MELVNLGRANSVCYLLWNFPTTNAEKYPVIPCDFPCFLQANVQGDTLKQTTIAYLLPLYY